MHIITLIYYVMTPRTTQKESKVCHNIIIESFNRSIKQYHRKQKLVFWHGPKAIKFFWPLCEVHVHEFRSRTLKNFSIEYHIIKSIVVVELKSLLFFTCFEILSFCTFVNIMDIIFASVSNKGPLFLKLMAFSQYSVLLQTISKIQVPKSKKSQHRLYCNCLTDRFSISCKR